ncbi:hypothetical protein GY45DRAFT_274412 [Cubamyces sp. BRFM 1775]|nr:hypothetical protein GY45DRAFT_274412 [Cubamyces sp. BRFM 1775]
MRQTHHSRGASRSPRTRPASSRISQLRLSSSPCAKPCGRGPNCREPLRRHQWRCDRSWSSAQCGTMGACMPIMRGTCCGENSVEGTKCQI